VGGGKHLFCVNEKEFWKYIWENIGSSIFFLYSRLYLIFFIWFMAPYKYIFFCFFPLYLFLCYH
jgi:hypothetical protein